MRSWFRRSRWGSSKAGTGKRSPRRPALETLEARCVPASGAFVQTNLVSDILGMATDPPNGTPDSQLKNPWGVAFGPGGPIWVADEGTGVATLYNGQGVKQGLVVTIPPAAGDPFGPQGTPTGIVFNGNGGFNVSETDSTGTRTGSSLFIFDSLDGTISGWSPGVDLHKAITKVTMPGSVFTGLAIGTDSMGNTRIYAADTANGVIDVFKSDFTLDTTLTAKFKDPTLPADASPFNIQAIGDKLYVEYTEGKAGPGHGFVDVFNLDGTAGGPHGKARLISHSALDSPWGVTLAPSTFGAFAGDLLVGNFGNGHINAFNPKNGHFIGEVTDATGKPFTEDHLWSLQFGSGGKNVSPDTLIFSAGINGEKDGLLGTLQPVPKLVGGSVVAHLPPGPEQTFSTVPPTTGDLNPYGVAFVPQGIAPGGMLHAGDLLVSNFNNSQNVQGTGSTIVRIGPEGEHSVFFQGQPGLGLTTALGVLKSGFVLVGSVPTTDGTAATIQPGGLLILDSNGKLVTTLTDSALLDGPWDLTINDEGSTAQVFVANVLSGTVTRIDLKIPKGGTPMVESLTQIGSGFGHVPNMGAVVLGPTGLAFDAQHDILYVASTADNSIFAISNAEHRTSDAGTGRLVYHDDAHLRGPLGLALLPNGDLVTANGDAVNGDPAHPSELVEFTPSGHFVSQFALDPGQDAAFGLAVERVGNELKFAAVNDNQNTVEVWTFQLPSSHHHHNHADLGDQDRD
jgi:uncharacterized protein (TIGR03118 family)